MHPQLKEQFRLAKSILKPYALISGPVFIAEMLITHGHIVASVGFTALGPGVALMLKAAVLARHKNGPNGPS
jgi:hypothetical protein